MDNFDLSGGICKPDSNQFSSSSEDLLNLLLEFDREPSNLVGLGTSQQLDQDERVGIENIRKQLMNCEVQSGPSSGPSQQPQPQQQQQQHQQQPHQQMLAADQSMLHGSYSNASISTVPASSSGQSYAPQQQQLHVTRISQSNPMSIVNNSPSPTWQQPQLSPYSPQTPTNNPRTPSQRQGQQQHHSLHQQQHSMQQQQHQTTTSPQLQLHHPLQRSPSQSVSPPATTEPSPVVKKNPLLNAQLVNSRTPSITPTRFMNSQISVLNQNPILNAKLSQSPFVSNNDRSVVGSPVNPSLNPQSRFIQQSATFNYDITQQQQQQQNAQHHNPQHMSLFEHGDQQQQQTNQIFRNTNTVSSGINTGGGASLNMGNISPSGGLSQQVKQEIRRKVQQPKQHQTTSLLKQLLSDDNK